MSASILSRVAAVRSRVPAGAATAPPSRRGDHLLAAVAGLVLAPVLLRLASWAAQQAPARTLVALALLLALLLADGAAQLLFARRSSLGAMVAGVVALALQLAAVLAPARAGWVGVSWLDRILPAGTVLVLAAILLGGAWGMRIARRAGRSEARLAVRLSAEDTTMGRTPVAPPARRRDHVLSLVLTLLGVPLALTYLRHSFTDTLVAGGPRLSAPALLALVQIVLLVALTGRSSLGARATGLLLAVLSLPALVSGAWSGVPGQGVVGHWYPLDPSGVTTAAAGLALTAAGWGAHLARRQGRAGELVEARAVESSTPPSGLRRT